MVMVKESKSKYGDVKYLNSNINRLLQRSGYERRKELKTVSKEKLRRMIGSQLTQINRLRNLVATTRIELNFLSRQNKMLENRLAMVIHKRTFKNIHKRLKQVRRERR